MTNTAPPGLRHIPAGQSWEQMDADLARALATCQEKSALARKTAAKARATGLVTKSESFNSVARVWKLAAQRFVGGAQLTPGSAYSTEAAHAANYRYIRDRAVWRSGPMGCVTWDLEMAEPDTRDGHLTDTSVGRELDAALAKARSIAQARASR